LLEVTTNMDVDYYLFIMHKNAAQKCSKIAHPLGVFGASVTLWTDC